MTALACVECTPLQALGFWLLMVTVIVVTIWIVTKIVASIRVATYRYPFPEAHYQAIVKQIQQVNQSHPNSDGFAQRSVMMQTIDLLAENNPEVDSHRKAIWQRLEREEWSITKVLTP